MLDYFKPWRRKIGVVTLGLTCVIAMWWARSTLVGDFAALSNKEFITTNGALIIRFAGSDAPRDFAYEAAILDGTGGYDDEWDWRRCGFGYRSFPVTRFINGLRSHSTTCDYRIPYCPIAIPLTLLSAWLLLSKPRTARKPESPHENSN